MSDPGYRKCPCGDRRCEKYVLDVGQYDGRMSKDWARLYAAAPELLAALKGMLALDCVCDGCTAGRAAVAKAEGTSWA